ncbi:hypothetical protein HDC95_001044, partial [Microbacterium sp. AK031]|nr:hypothetical protein [Microbacterium sp. AK031]
MVKLFPPGTRAAFVDLVCAGATTMSAAASVGAGSASASRWWAQSGGMKIDKGRTGGLADPVPEMMAVSERMLT